MLLLAAQSADAVFSATLTAPNGDGPLDPERESRFFQVTATLDCSDLLQRSSVDAGQNTQAGVTAQLTWDLPSSVFAMLITDAIQFDASACGTGAASVQASNGIELFASRDLPALTPTGIWANLTLPGGPARLPELHASAQAYLKAKPFIFVQAKMPVKTFVRSHGAVTPSLEVHNVGNAPVTVEAILQGNATGSFQPLQLARGATGWMNATVTVDGSAQEFVHIHVMAKAADGTASPTLDQTFLVAREKFLGVPGPALPLLVVALALVAARRRT